MTPAMKTDGPNADAISLLEQSPLFHTLINELETGISRFWETAEKILRQTGIRVIDSAVNDFSIETNFFSLLFLYSFYRAGIPEKRRVLYSCLIQCLRGMVTGCDNLLDDEYKKTLETDIPASAPRFRSVMDIMVSDRVLCEILLETCRTNGLRLENVSEAVAVSMKTMARSGMQEASEEGGVTTILKPDELLQTVHHYKTGILFKCPWDIPNVIEDIEPAQTKHLLDSLYHIGIGCQILDDMVDFTLDLNQKRHNYAVSSIYYGHSPSEKGKLQERPDKDNLLENTVNVFKDYPETALHCHELSRRFLENGLSDLFAPEHRFLVQPAIRFLEKRIGIRNLKESAA